MSGYLLNELMCKKSSLDVCYKSTTCNYMIKVMTCNIAKHLNITIFLMKKICKQITYGSEFCRENEIPKRIDYAMYGAYLW